MEDRQEHKQNKGREAEKHLTRSPIQTRKSESKTQAYTPRGDG